MSFNRARLFVISFLKITKTPFFPIEYNVSTRNVVRKRKVPILFWATFASVVILSLIFMYHTEYGTDSKQNSRIEMQFFRRIFAILSMGIFVISVVSIFIVCYKQKGFDDLFNMWSRITGTLCS